MTALLNTIVGYILTLIAVVSNIQGFTTWLNGVLRTGGAPIAAGSLMNEWFITYNSVLAQGELLADATTGLVAAHAERQAILAALAALPAGSDLPPVGSQDPQAVWEYQNGYRDTTGNMLSKMDETNTRLGPNAAYEAPATSWFGVYNPTSFVD